MTFGAHSDFLGLVPFGFKVTWGSNHVVDLECLILS